MSLGSAVIRRPTRISAPNRAGRRPQFAIAQDFPSRTRVFGDEFFLFVDDQHVRAIVDAGSTSGGDLSDRLFKLRASFALSFRVWG
jgi:hypothetical protein